jgi:hypothetical protein
MVASPDHPVPVVPSQVLIPGAGRPLGSAIQRRKTGFFDVVRTGETPPDVVSPGHFRGCWGCWGCWAVLSPPPWVSAFWFYAELVLVTCVFEKREGTA